MTTRFSEDESHFWSRNTVNTWQTLVSSWISLGNGAIDTPDDVASWSFLPHVVSGRSDEGGHNALIDSRWVLCLHCPCVICKESGTIDPIVCAPAGFICPTCSHSVLVPCSWVTSCRILAYGCVVWPFEYRLQYSRPPEVMLT